MKRHEYEIDFRPFYIEFKDGSDVLKYDFEECEKYVEIKLSCGRVWELVEENFINEFLISATEGLRKEFAVFNHETFKDLMNELGLWEKCLDRYADKIYDLFLEDAQEEREHMIEEQEQSREEYKDELHQRYECGVFESDFH